MINKNNFLGTVNNYSNNHSKKYILVKDINFEIVESPKTIINYENNLKIINKQFTQTIYNFITTIENETPVIDLNVFFNNLKTLIIEEKKFMLFQKISPGQYDINKNKIILKKNEVTSSIYHELLHCASSKKTKDTLFSGFYQTNDNGNIGRGINEGYTALLQERFFNQETSYNINKVLSAALEKIVGKQKMYNFYFDANLFGLINELKKYIEEDKIISFIIDVDNFTDFAINKKPFNKHDEKIKGIVRFLLQCFINKIINLYDNNIVNDDELYILINDFIVTLDYECTVGKWKFELLPEELINEIVMSEISKTENQKNKAI